MTYACRDAVVVTEMVMMVMVIVILCDGGESGDRNNGMMTIVELNLVMGMIIEIELNC